jgi:hypothetical protein
MIDILHSRFKYGYFLICIDEFDIILPQKYAGEDYREKVVNFLNGLNEISKELSKRPYPTLLVLLQTEYANKIFLDYIKRLSDATASRISPRTDITLGYDLNEVIEFVISRLEPERIKRAEDPLHPFSREVVEVLYREYEDKAEKKVLSLRVIEKSLLDLLDMGLKNNGKITTEMAQQVATIYAAEAKPSEVLYKVPPEAIERAREDLVKTPVERANAIMTCIEKILSTPKTIRNVLGDPESLDITSDYAILRKFYEFGYGNETYDCAVLYAVFKGKINVDLQEYVNMCMEGSPYPQLVLVFLHAPLESVSKLKNAEIVGLTGKDLELLFSIQYLPEIPSALDREFAYIISKINEALSKIRDIPKTSSVPKYCIRTLIGVILAYCEGGSSAEKINDFLELIYGQRYESTLSQYLSSLEGWGLVLPEEGRWKPCIPPSLEYLLRFDGGHIISRKEFKEKFPDNRFKNLEKLCIELGFYSKDEKNYLRKTKEDWKKKLDENYEFIKQHGKEEDSRLRHAKRLEKIAVNAPHPWCQVVYKFAFDFTNEIVSEIRMTEETLEGRINELKALKEKVITLEPRDKFLQELKKDLLSKIENGLKSPATVDIEQLREEYSTLETSVTETKAPSVEEHEIEKALEQVGPVLGIPEMPKIEEGFPEIEKAVLIQLEGKSMTLMELCDRITEYSRDVIKTAVMNLLEKGIICLTKGVNHDKKE